MIITTVLTGMLLIAVTLILYFVIIYNGLVSVKNNFKKAWSNIDVLLKQRYDELPKLVKVCERYMKHEAETLEKVIKARSMIADAGTLEQMSKGENMLTDALKSLFAVSEAYPDLKADSRFGQLQTRISELENEISDRRELYNEHINIYNIRIEKLPDVFVARLLNYRPKEMWEINPAERKDPGIRFSD